MRIRWCEAAYGASFVQANKSNAVPILPYASKAVLGLFFL